MIKRFLCVFCAMLFAFSAFKTTQSLAKVEEETKKCSLEIVYSKNSTFFQNLKIKIHRIADENFNKVSPYDSLPVSVLDITSNKEWQQTALTLESYINADKIKPYQTSKTSKKGVVNFSNLETGLYLVCGVNAETKTENYKFDSFLISLPFYQNGEYNYNVKSKPKSSKVVKEDKIVEYKVIKLWRDRGNKQNRPKSVKVDILKNGEVDKTVKLSSSNNWVYSFKAKADEALSVVERNVSNDYKVKINNNRNSFTLTNTYRENELKGNGEGWLSGQGPSTGDTFPFTFYLITMCVSGLLLIVVGIMLMRGSKK